jgi:hypothetical protein
MKTTLLLPALAVFSGTAMAASGFQLDFANASTTAQPGWQTLGGTGSPSGSFPGFTGLSDGNITVSLTNISFDRLYKNGSTGSPDDFPGTTLDNMYSDLLFRNVTGTPITITVGGLKAGTYTFTTHHLNAVNTPSEFDLRVQDADSPAFGQFVGNFAMGLGLGAPLTPASFNPTVISFDAVSNGNDPIILQMDATVLGTGGNTGGWWGINGLEIIPEPSTALLGALGMLALLRRRR